jgi:hypothetical protein
VICRFFISQTPSTENFPLKFAAWLKKMSLF